MRADFRFALRLLVKSPGFTAVAVLSLALGIGANTTVFCWIQSTLLRAIPGIVEPARMVVLVTRHGTTIWDGVSYPDLKDYARLTNVLAGVIGSQVTPACLSMGGKPEWIYGQVATANLFEVLGVRPVLGRGFLAEEEQKPGGHPVLVLSHGFWQRRFAADPHILGQTVELNRHPFTIVGVAPPDFQGTMGGLRCDFWAPLMMHEPVANFGSTTARGDHWLHTQARLRRGVTRQEAQAALDLLARQLEQAYPDTNRDTGLKALRVWEAPYGGQAGLLPVLRILMVVSLGVLLIVAANVANLLLARAGSRRKEIAIRLALGAPRWRLVRQLMTESVLLALAGGLLGVGLAFWGRNAVMSFLPNTYLPIGYTFAIDAPTLGFTLGLTLVTAFVFGLVPAWQATRPALQGTLKEGGRTSGAGVPHHRLRRLLVVLEVALTLLLLVGAGLCIQGFQRARHVDLGFDPNGVLLAGLRVGMHGYNEQTGKVFYRQLQQRLQQVPGVEAVALASWLPLGFEGGGSRTVQVDGYSPSPGEDLSLPYSIVSPGYFAVMRIPVLEGRDFQDRDDGERPWVAVINETMARRFWPGQSALGRKFRLSGGQREVTVVGVVKAGRYRALNEAPRSFFYLPYTQGVWDLNLGVAMRTTGQPLALSGALRREIQALDPGVEIWASLPMTEFIQAAFVMQRIAATLLVTLGSVALGLAALGIYGVMAYVVSQRTHELGVRLALGAQAGDIRRLVLRESLRLTAIGVGCGVLGGLGVTRLLAGFLYGVSPFDPWTFGAVAAGLSGVALVAAYGPAHRAGRLDPNVALRLQ